MTLDDVKQILDLVKEHELTEFELEREGLKIRIRKDARGRIATELPTITAHAGVAEPAAVHAAASVGGPIAAASATEDSAEFGIVKSPIVGTFYRSPDPTSAPFVNVGDKIRIDTRDCSYITRV